MATISKRNWYLKQFLAFMSSLFPTHESADGQINTTFTQNISVLLNFSLEKSNLIFELIISKTNEMMKNK
jgi:hypothetical protein